MKRIIIVTPTLRCGGGVISGLKNLLALLPTNKYQIDVLPMGFSDTNNVHLMNCNILSDNFNLTATTSVYAQTKGYKKRKMLKAAKLFLTLFNVLGKRRFIENIVFQLVAKKYSDYDIAIAYQEGPCTHFVQYIAAPHRIAWIHCDYPEYCKLNLSDEENVYNQYQSIVCVSQYTLNNFLTVYPRLFKRSLYIHNLLDDQFIIQSSLENSVDAIKECKVRLISVGRIHSVKQFHLIPSIINSMQELGATDFEWILIGDIGEMAEYKLLLSEIDKYNIDSNVFRLLGPKFNPFPYIKNSDILVSTSHSEACPFVVNEARVLGIPVVSNNYPAIYEFINDGINGRICPLNKLSQVLSELVIDKNKLIEMQNSAKSLGYINTQIIERTIELFEKDLNA